MAFNWTTARDAIYNVVKDACPNGTVCQWGYQHNERPTPLLVQLHVTSIETLNPNPQYTVIDNPSPASGAEILIKTREDIEVVVQVQVFSKEPEAGANAAKWIAEKIKMRFPLESATESLSAAGVELIERTRTQALPAVLETKFESRATFDLRLRAVDGDSETATYIETYEYDAIYED